MNEDNSQTDGATAPAESPAQAPTDQNAASSMADLRQRRSARYNPGPAQTSGFPARIPDAMLRTWGQFWDLPFSPGATQAAVPVEGVNGAYLFRTGQNTGLYTRPGAGTFDVSRETDLNVLANFDPALEQVWSQQYPDFKMRPLD